MLRIAICDDDIETFHHVKMLLGHLGVQELMTRDVICTIDDYYKCGDAFITGIQKKSYDVVFMDIELQNEKGMDIVKKMYKLTYKPKVIFVSNHTDYFRDLAEVGLFSFLLKPMKIVDFNKVMKKLFEALDDESDIFMFSYNSMKVKVPVNDIISIEKLGRRTLISTKEKEYEVSSTLKCVMEKLNSRWFITPSTSYAVNYNHITYFHKKKIVLSNGKEVNIPDRKRKATKEHYLSMRKEKCS